MVRPGSERPGATGGRRAVAGAHAPRRAAADCCLRSGFALALASSVAPFASGLKSPGSIPSAGESLKKKPKPIIWFAHREPCVSISRPSVFLGRSIDVGGPGRMGGSHKKPSKSRPRHEASGASHSKKRHVEPAPVSQLPAAEPVLQQPEITELEKKRLAVADELRNVERQVSARAHRRGARHRSLCGAPTPHQGAAADFRAGDQVLGPVERLWQRH